MDKTVAGILIVEDFEPWRRFLCSTIHKRSEYRVISQVSDGLRAVQKAEELHPDLILMDIGLPVLDGIESARRIRKVSPASKILFVSEHRAWDVAEEALRIGGNGYVIKSDAGTDLLPAIEAVLTGRQFISISLLRAHPGDDAQQPPTDLRPTKIAAQVTRNNPSVARRHEAAFYSDDSSLLDHVTQFIGTALSAGNVSIVLATESHRNQLLRRLRATRVNVATAVEQRRYIALDASDSLSALMLNGMPHPVRFFRVFSDLIVPAGANNQVQRRVAIFGECVHLLWMQGNPEAAIELERLGNQLANMYDVDILCGYSLSSFQGGMGSYVFDKIYAQHSVVYSK